MAKANLLRAAREEFAAVGLVAARVADITRRARLAKGTFYLHFKTKEAAFRTLVDGFFAELSMFADCYEAHCEDVQSCNEWRGRVRLQDEQMLGFLWNSRDLLRILYSSQASPTHRHLIESFLDAQVARLVPQIEKLQKKGLYRPDVDATVIAVSIVGAWNELCRRMTTVDKKPDVARTVESFNKLYLEGLFTRPG